MSGNSPLFNDRTFRESIPAGGYREDNIRIPLAEFFANNAGTQVALTLATGTQPFRAFANAGTLVPWPAIRWDNAAGTNPVIAGFRVPGHYDRDTDELLCLVTARYAGATGAVDFRIRCQAEFFLPGTVSPNIANTAEPTTTAPSIGLASLVNGDATSQTIDGTSTTSRTTTKPDYIPPGTYANNYLLERKAPTIAAVPGAGVPTAVHEYAFNLSLETPGRLSAGTNNINVIKPGTFVALALRPSIAAGANNFLDIFAVTMRIRRNACMGSRNAQYGYDRLRDTVA